MTWKTLVFLNDSSWKQTVVACAKYWSDPGKGWPAAGCTKWKLYVAQTALWSGCIASCMICEYENRDLASVGKTEPCRSASFLRFVLNSSLRTCSLTSCRRTDALLIPPFLCKWRKTCISDTHCARCFTLRYDHHAEPWSIPFLHAMPTEVEQRLRGEGLPMSHH